MSAAGSREEMLEALQQVRQAMARRVPTPTDNNENNINNNMHNSTGLQIYEGEESTPRPRPQIHSEAKDNRSHFFDTWCRKIEMFVADPTKTTLELPAELAANDRRELHMLAEKYNLSHHSRGVGSSRQLVLKKDALHYRMPDVRPENIENIKQTAGDKQSKYHLRRTRQDVDAAIGTIGAFGDETTAQMVRRLDRATDEYRKAVEIGYSQQELLALEAGETLESVLSRANTQDTGIHSMDITAVGVSGESIPSTYNTHNNNHHNNNNNIHQGTSTSEKKQVVYDEVCLRCGSRARVDYDVQKWECNGYCGECATQTIWKLVEVEVSNNRPEELILSPVHAGRKRNRQEAGIEEDINTSSVPTAQRPQQEQREEIDKDNDEDDTITVEDVVDMANMNDFSAADVNWIRRFATHHQPQESKSVLSKHIVFCIEFNDLFSMRIFRDFLTPKEDKQRGDNQQEEDSSELPQKEHKAWFVYLREVKDAGVHLSTILEELTASMPERYDRLSVAFPNMSVYGTAASCVCLLSSPVVEESFLESLQRKYGRDNVRFSRNLSTVLQGDGNSA